MCGCDEVRAFVDDVKKKGNEVGLQLTIHDNDPVEITVSILYAKLIMDLKSIALLIDNRFVDQSYIIMRTMLDKLFVLTTIVNDESKMTELISHFDYQQAKKIKNGFNLGLIDDSEKDIRLSELGGKNISTSKWAEWAGMKDTYEREYAIFSDSIHVSSRLIQDCLVTDSGKIKAIDMNPNLSMGNVIILTATHYVLQAIEKVCECFKVEMKDQKEMEERFAAISSPYFKEQMEDERRT